MDSPLGDYGEDRLLEALLAELPPAGASVRAGAGEDDCAIIRRPNSGRCQLLKTDCLIESVHFAADTPPQQIGWKALCRPLSDIAAMGGKPAQALVTIALSGESSVETARGVYHGIGRAAREFGVDVVGGEMARSPGPLFLSVCVTGSVKAGRAARRSGGRPRDHLYVTGRLGGSFASGRHLNFQPRLREARWLVRRFSIRAMLDLSDGLGADLPRLAKASGTGFSVAPDRLPCAPGCSPAQAINDGEDYELLLAIAPADAEPLQRAWARKFPDLPLTAIGHLAEPGVAGGLDGTGYDHFAPG